MVPREMLGRALSLAGLFMAGGLLAPAGMAAESAARGIEEVIVTAERRTDYEFRVHQQHHG